MAGARGRSAKRIPAAEENRLLIQWIIGDLRDDIRFSLANILHSAQVKQMFNRVILDVSPRLGTASIAALSASTHVLIPTVLDGLSGEAVGGFINQIEIHRKMLWPRLRVIGVAPQLVSANLASVKEREPDIARDELLMRLTNAERAGHAEIEASIKRVRTDLKLSGLSPAILPPETFIARAAPIAQSAGQSIAFLDISNELKQMYRNLGLEVATRMMTA
jgi:cellulose biosynthesis protein BcsQ